MIIVTSGGCDPRSPLGDIKESGADVGAGVRCRAARIEVEEAVVAVAVIVAADEQRIGARARVHIVRHVSRCAAAVSSIRQECPRMLLAVTETGDVVVGGRKRNAGRGKAGSAVCEVRIVRADIAVPGGCHEAVDPVVTSAEGLLDPSVLVVGIATVDSMVRCTIAGTTHLRIGSIALTQFVLRIEISELNQVKQLQRTPGCNIDHPPVGTLTL